MSDRDSLYKRIEALNGKPLQHKGEEEKDDPELHRVTIKNAKTTSSKTASIPPPPSPLLGKERENVQLPSSQRERENVQLPSSQRERENVQPPSSQRERENVQSSATPGKRETAIPSASTTKGSLPGYSYTKNTDSFSQIEPEGVTFPRTPLRGQTDNKPFSYTYPRRQQSARQVRENDEIVALEEVVDGAVFECDTWGNAYEIITPLSSLNDFGTDLNRTFEAMVLSEESALQQCFLARCGVYASLSDLLFVDLETTGLSQTPLFLIGTLFWENDGLVIKQYLARDYSEEGAVIAQFLKLTSTDTQLVSFNGKSFDIRYVRMRAISNGIRCRLPNPHFDMLHESRRIWRAQLPNCKLQTLEQRICGHPKRFGDIPGDQIPDAYHEYVHTKDAWQIVKILEHNRIDLITLAELMTKMPCVRT